MCWGYNQFGQLDVPSETFTQVSAGGAYACALKTDANVVCWGSNEYGQLTVPY